MSAAEALETIPGMVEIRAGSELHWPFVLKTWVMSYAASDFARPIRPGVFHTFHRALAERMLRRVELRIATPAEDDNLFLGWAALEPQPLEPQVLHYVYVKPQFRQLGIAKRLLGGLKWGGLRFTHQTQDGKRLVEKRSGAVYNPYLVG